MKYFYAKVVITNHKKIKEGYQPILHAHNTHVASKVIAIIDKSNSLNAVQKYPPFVSTGDTCQIVFEPTKPF